MESVFGSTRSDFGFAVRSVRAANRSDFGAGGAAGGAGAGAATAAGFAPSAFARAAAGCNNDSKSNRSKSGGSSTGLAARFAVPLGAAGRPAITGSPATAARAAGAARSGSGTVDAPGTTTLTAHFGQSTFDPAFRRAIDNTPPHCVHRNRIGMRTPNEFRGRPFYRQPPRLLWPGFRAGATDSPLDRPDVPGTMRLPTPQDPSHGRQSPPV